MAPRGTLTPAAEAFFGKLPKALSQEEETLLRLLKEVGGAVDAFLPACVTLQDWAERRVPKAQAAKLNRSGLVFVGGSDAGPIGASEARQLPVKASAPPAFQAASRIVGAGKTDQAPATPAAPAKGAGGKGRGQKGGQSSADFLKSLPTDGFTEAESALRDAILASLRQGRKKNMKLFCNSVYSNHTIRPALDAFLPQSVSVTDWVEHRIGAEVQVNTEDNGKKYFGIVVQSAEEKAEAAEAFFSQLPEDAFLPGEQELREAILRSIDSLPPGKATLATCGSDKGVGEARKSLLPEGVSLLSWCERRMGGEVETMPVSNGQIAIGLMGTLDASVVNKVGPPKPKRPRTM